MATNIAEQLKVILGKPGLQVGSGTNGPTATTPYLVIPIVTDDPTGVPDMPSGMAALVFGSDAKLWVYTTGTGWIRTDALVSA
jgi:hypothetical protein